MNHHFKLKNAALLMALAAVYPMAAHSAAGVAQFAIGDVSVRRGASATPLAKGQLINPGDNIVTGAGQAQLRFTDGGLVSLTPNSQFNIDKYADENDPNKDSFAVSLLRGGMRAITGLIGKRKNDNYKVTTSTATIGIRGSGFFAKHNVDGTLDVSGEQDEIVVCTNAGCVNLIVGESVRVTDSNSVPGRLVQRSNVPPLVPRQDLFVPENPAVIEPPPINPPVIVPPVLPTLLNGVLTGVSAMFAFGDGGVDYYLRGGQDPSDGEGTFLDGQMVRHTGTENPYGGNSALVEKTSTGPGSFGTRGGATDPAFIGWGYWDTGTISNPGTQTLTASSEDVSRYTGVHYVVGRPTPQAQMPVTGAAHYTFLGGTAPTAYDSETSTLRVGTLVDASLNVNFMSGRVMGLVNTSFTVGNESVAVQVFDVGQITDAASFRSVGCGNGFFRGFFTGDQASRAGLVYGVNDGQVGEVRGSAVFLNTGGGVTDMSAMFATVNGSGFSPGGLDQSPRGSQFSGFSDPSKGTAYFDGKQMVAHDDGGDSGFYGGDSTVFAALGPVSSFDALGNPGDHDYIGWGYWAKGAKASDYSGTSNLAGVHYIVGRPTRHDEMPLVGTATYALTDGTAPTATLGATIIVGSLVSANLSVDFGAFTVNSTVNTSFTKNGGAVPVAFTDQSRITGSKFTSTGCGTGKVNGFFVGNQAIRAGIVYSANDETVGLVRGAAAFTRGTISPPQQLEAAARTAQAR